MTESGFQGLKAEVLQMLTVGLDPQLTYHSLAHTIDVMAQAERIAVSENVTDSRILLLLQIATLFHDTGFLYTYKGHEEKSCEILDEHIDASLFSLSEIVLIKDMIMATKIPQSAVSLPEMIICDADLDYLGREDFEVISENLRKEMIAFDFIKSNKEWYIREVDFIESHRYYTVTSQRLRQPSKIQYLEKLRQHE